MKTIRIGAALAAQTDLDFESTTSSTVEIKIRRGCSAQDSLSQSLIFIKQEGALVALLYPAKC